MRKLAFALMTLAACSGGDNRKVDAGIGTDASDIDAAVTTPVKLTITSNGAGVANVRVHFLAPDSTVISSTETDSSGVATAVMPNGGTVTAINPFTSATGGSFYDVRTFSAVEPGDELVLEDTGGSAELVTFTIPRDSDNTAARYTVHTPCGEADAEVPQTGNPTAELYFDEQCAAGTDVVVTSTTLNGDVVHWLYAQNVTPTSNAIDLSSMALTQTPTTKTFTFNNVPSWAKGVIVADALASTKGNVYTFFTGFGGNGSIMRTAPLAVFPNAFETLVLQVQTNSNIGSHGLGSWGPFSDSYTTDVMSRLLAELTTDPTVDIATKRLVWTQEATGQTADFVVAQTRNFRNSTSIYWEIIAPYTAGEIQFPTLPVEGVDLNFTTGDDASLGELFLARMPGGYDAVREGFFSADGPTELGLGPTGSFEIIQMENSNTRTVGQKVRGRADRTSPVPAWMVRPSR